MVFHDSYTTFISHVNLVLPKQTNSILYFRMNYTIFNNIFLIKVISIIIVLSRNNFFFFDILCRHDVNGIFVSAKRYHM